MSEPTFKDFKQAKADAESRLAPCPWCGGGGEIRFGHIDGAGPTIYVECLDCGHVFPAEDAAQREPELGDCCPPWASIDICPECFSDELMELQRCVICGNPVHDEQSDFCMGCQFIIDTAFQGAIESAARHLNWEELNNKNALIRLMFDRAEERHLYQEEGETNG